MRAAADATVSNRVAPLDWPGAPAALALTSALAVFLGAQLAYSLAVSGVVVVWFPAGISLALLLAFRARNWPAILIGAYLGNLVVDYQTTRLVGFALLAPVANLAESLVAAAVVRRLSSNAFLSRPLDGAVAIVVGAAALSNAVTALLGAALLHSTYGGSFGRLWVVWWVGDGLGMIVATPAVLGLVMGWRALREHGVRSWGGSSRGLEAALLLGLVVLVPSLVFASPATAAHGTVGALAIIPLLTWVALRLGPVVSLVASALLTVVVLWHTSAGRGPLAQPELSSVDQAVHLYAFLAVASLSVVVLTALIAERDAASRRLRVSEARYRAVVDTAPDAILTVDPDGRIRFCNHAVETLVGAPEKELLGSSVFELVTEDYRKPLEERFQRYVGRAPGSPRRAIEFEIRHRDGRRIPAEIVFGEWVEEDEGRVTGIARDLSDRKRLEQQLRHSHKLESLGQLTAGVAHEFRNQLLVIQANLDLAEAEVGGSEAELRSYMKGIQAALEHSSSMVRDLLAFGRRQPLRPTVLDLDELLARSLRTIEPLLNETIRVELSRSDARKLVRVDAVALEQSILNLLLNARDAMPSGGRLSIGSGTVTVDEPLRRELSLPGAGEFATLDVADTGSGMAPEVLSRAFEPFYSTKREGTGLGLAAVYGTLRQSGGAVQAQSRPGEGTRFRLYLPCAEASSTETAPPART